MNIPVLLFAWSLHGHFMVTVSQVYVGQVEGELELCGTVNYVAGKNVYKIVCGDAGLSGDVVKVTNADSYLTLCEVQVLGKFALWSAVVNT